MVGNEQTSFVPNPGRSRSAYVDSAYCLPVVVYLGTLMSLFEFIIGHRHHFGVWHRRSSDGKLIQRCYECGREREVKVRLEV